MSGERHQRATVWLGLLNGAYALFLFGLTVLNWLGADRWWLGALNLYLPQAIWLIPILLLAMVSLKYAPRWIWVQGLLLVWVAGPNMGFCWNFHTGTSTAPAGTTVRVMTCNVKNGHRDVLALIRDIVRDKPDVVFLQEIEKDMKGPLGAFFKDWNVRSADQYAIASRLPLAMAEVRKLSFPGTEWPILRTKVQVGNTAIALYSVHLLTPREGLNALRVTRRRPGFLPDAIARLQDNVDDRLIQARTLADFIQLEGGAVIVAGDLNSPDSSLACGMLREAGLHDAFKEGGRGYGYTYGHFLLRNRLPWMDFPWMRIDHIMLSPHLESRQCWTGTSRASDHRPVVADVVVKGP